MRTTLTARQIPLFRAAIPFAIGICMGHYLKISLSWYVLVTIGSLSIFLLSYNRWSKNYFIKSWLLQLTLISMGLLIYSTNGLKRQYKQENEVLLDSRMHIGLIYDISQSDNYITYFSEVKGTNTAVKVRKPQDRVYKRGENIEINSAFSKIESKPSLSGFDYGQYLIDKGIYYQSFPKTERLHFAGSDNSFLYIIRYDIRNWALDIISRYFSNDNKGILSALLLGDRSGLSSEVRDNFADSGIVHILAVSGLHVGIVLYILYFLTSPLERVSKHVRYVIIGIGLIFFAELSGGAPPVLRAVIMSVIYLIGKSLNQKSHPLNLIGTAAAILLAYNPMQLFSVSFQLSFSAVIGIILFAPWLFKFWKPQNKILKWAWSIITLGITAQIGTVPFTLYYFHQLPLLSPILGLLAIPIAGGLIGIGFLLLGFEFLGIQVFSGFIKSITDTLIEILTFCTSMAEWFPHTLIKDVWVTNYESGVLLCAIIAISFWLYYKKRWFYIGSLTCLFLFITSYQIRVTLQMETVQSITYQADPMIRDYFLRGKVYQLGHPEVKHMYEVNEVRSRYRGKEIITIDNMPVSNLTTLQ